MRHPEANVHERAAQVYRGTVEERQEVNRPAVFHPAIRYDRSRSLPMLPRIQREVLQPRIREPGCFHPLADIGDRLPLALGRGPPWADLLAQHGEVLFDLRADPGFAHEPAVNGRPVKRHYFISFPQLLAISPLWSHQPRSVRVDDPDSRLQAGMTISCNSLLL